MRVLYRKDGFAILHLREGRKDFTVVGELAQYEVGQRLAGRFTPEEHPRYGTQYRYIPAEAHEAAERFLSEMFMGLGPKTAKRIVEGLGPSLSYMQEPELLRDMAGIPLAKAQRWAQRYLEVAPDWQNHQVLYALDLSPKQRAQATRKWKDRTAQVLAQNPYRQMELEGVGFLIADGKARKLGVRTDDPRRLKAAAVFLLEGWLDWGHTAVSHSRLLQSGQRLGLTPEQTETALALAQEEGQLYAEENLWGLQAVRNTELKLSQLAAPATPASWPRGGDVDLAALFSLLRKHRTAALTGAAGTGKTTLIAKLLAATQQNVVLAAPTGKAARRLEEVLAERGLQYPASTLHRLLGENDEMPECDLLIVDEASMVDVFLLSRVQKALGQAQLLLVGDINQLPPVGPGQPFKDLLPDIGHLSLTTVHRQAAQNPIVQAAHRVLTGQRPTFDHDPRLRWAPLDEPQDLLLALPDAPPRPVILSPTRKGPFGSDELNPMLQQRFGRLSGAKVQLGNGWARVGDPVMCAKNNYELEVMNGEVGLVREVNPDGSRMVLELGERLIALDETHLADFQLAYAITVHKFQGSQAPWVYLLLHPTQRPLLSRELLYTGLTRASEGLVLLGQTAALDTALRTQAARRVTWLGYEQLKLS